MNYFYDFKLDAWSTIEFILEGKKGTKVELAVGECLANGKLNRAPGGSRIFQTNEVTLNGGIETFRFMPKPGGVQPIALKSPFEFEIIPFRYAEIIGDCRVIEVKRTPIYPEEFDDNDSHFVSDDELLNKIWEMCKYTMKATAPFGMFIDGERERLPYEGDTYINQLGWFCNCSDCTIPRRTIEFLFKHHTWPFEWFLIMPQVVKDYMLYSNDTGFFAEIENKLEECLLSDLLDSDGLLAEREGDSKFRRTIVDWPLGERDNYEFGKVNLVSNCYYYHALNVMAELSNKAHYKTKALELKAVIRKKFIKNNIFVDSPESSHTSLHSSLFALHFGLGNIAECPDIDKKGMACSVYGSQFLLDCCFANGMAQHAKNLLLSKDLRSWYNMIEKGATITMEAWDDCFKPNQDWNHAWGAAPANIIPRRIAGIRPLEYGFRKFIFDPQTADLKNFYLKHPTCKGTIEVEFDNGKANLTVPEGTEALFKNNILGFGKHCLKI